jgi:hypothetical protein
MLRWHKQRYRCCASTTLAAQTNLSSRRASVSCSYDITICAAAADDEAMPSETVAAVAALEEAAAANTAAGGAPASDHGSRGSRGAARDASQTAAEAADAKRRRDRCLGTPASVLRRGSLTAVHRGNADLTVVCGALAGPCDHRLFCMFCQCVVPAGHHSLCTWHLRHAVRTAVSGWVSDEQPRGSGVASRLIASTVDLACVAGMTQRWRRLTMRRLPQKRRPAAPLKVPPSIGSN